jgi:alpha-1,2-rhamnosyltransferase
LFNVKTPVILSVGTVEPRKNHAMLLNAMERVWSEGNEARLVIAGRPGWMCDDLHDRLRNHAENQTRLYWFDDASDADIGYLYQNARLFAFPSVVEGFGLPIVESLFHGTPVVASDTQIHREVGRDRCEYFSLDDVEALKRLIVTASQTPKPSIAGEIEICSWRESARELLSKVILQKQAAKPAHQVDKMIDSFASKAA